MPVNAVEASVSPLNSAITVSISAWRLRSIRSLIAAVLIGFDAPHGNSRLVQATASGSTMLTASRLRITLRARLKEGRMVVPVELGAAELTWLVSVRWLTPAEADQGDARGIGQAIAAGLAASAKG
jgi:hypothetical protein